MDQERQRPLLPTLLPHPLVLEPRREEDEAIDLYAFGAREPEALAWIEVFLRCEVRREGREGGEVGDGGWGAFVG